MSKSEITSITAKTKNTSNIDTSNTNNNKINSLKINSSSSSSSSNRQILSEEIYTSTLQSIITRDYFPAIPSLQRDTAILAARAEGDTAKAVAIRRAARLLDKQRQLEFGNDNCEDSDIHPTTKLLKQTVDGFHKCATSEDNEEFEQNQADELFKHRSWIQNIFSPKINKNTLESENRMDDSANLLASDEFNATPAYEKKKLLPSNFTMKKSFDKDQSNEEYNLINTDKNPIANNSFFFTPLHKTIQNENYQTDGGTNVKHLKNDSNPDPKHLMPPPPPISTGNNNYINKYHKDNEKRIQASQTRFPFQAISSLPPTSCILSDGQENAMDNNASNLCNSGYDTSVSTDLDTSPTTSISHERKERQGYLEKNRYTYVNMTPLVMHNRNQSFSNDDMDEEFVNTLLSSTESNRYGKSKQKLNLKNTPHKKNTSSKHYITSKKRASLFVDRTASLTPAALSLFRRSLPREGKSRDLSYSLTPVANVSVREKGAFGSVLRKSYSSTPTDLMRRKIGSGVSNEMNVRHKTPRAKRKK